MDFTDLIGVPYRHHGRSLGGMDCYGIVIEFERRLGRELFDFDYVARDFREKEDYEVWKKSMKHWEETKEPSFGDVLLFFSGKGRVVHAAVFLKDGLMLHCDTQGSKVVKLALYQNQNWKAYRCCQ